jgi:hypothetical protein
MSASLVHIKQLPPKEYVGALAVLKLCQHSTTPSTTAATMHADVAVEGSYYFS